MSDTTLALDKDVIVHLQAIRREIEDTRQRLDRLANLLKPIEIVTTLRVRPQPLKASLRERVFTEPQS